MAVTVAHAGYHIPPDGRAFRAQSRTVYTNSKRPPDSPPRGGSAGDLCTVTTLCEYSSCRAIAREQYTRSSPAPAQSPPGTCCGSPRSRRIAAPAGCLGVEEHPRRTREQCRQADERVVRASRRPCLHVHRQPYEARRLVDQVDVARADSRSSERLRVAPASHEGRAGTSRRWRYRPARQRGAGESVG